jgi:hypothetical protein
MKGCANKSVASIISARVCAVVSLLLAGLAQQASTQGAAIEVTPSGTASAGSTVTVKWSGPNGPGDFITVVRKGAAPAEYLDYRRTSDGRAPVNPVSIVMPAEPGAYEIRYVRGNPRSVLASVAYEVIATSASLDGPASVAPDARFEVAWSGPNNGGDFVTIVAAGAAQRAYGSYVDARSGRADSRTGRTVATLRAPSKPGRYELRYVQRGTQVIGMRAIEVTATSSSGPSGTPPLTMTPVVPSAGVAMPQTPASGATGRLPPAAEALSKTTGTQPPVSAPQPAAATAPSAPAAPANALSGGAPPRGLTAVPGTTPVQIIIRESIRVTDALPSVPAPTRIEIRESIRVADDTTPREE